MNRHHLLFCFWLIFRKGIAADAAVPTSASLPPPQPSLPAPGPITPQAPPESTPHPESPRAPGPNTTSPPDPAPSRQNQTQAASSPGQPPRAGLPPQKTARAPFQARAEADRQDSSSSQQWGAAARGVEIVLMEPRGRLPGGEPRGPAGHAMGLFLGGCGLLLCLFIGIYCTYSRGAKKEPFSHHRLYEDAFDDPALFLDNPKEYDWFFYETDGYVYPTASQAQPPRPIQTLSIPALKQPCPALEGPPGKPETAEAVPDTQPPSPRLECLSPANLEAGNFL